MKNIIVVGTDRIFTEEFGKALISYIGDNVIISDVKPSSLQEVKSFVIDEIELLEIDHPINIRKKVKPKYSGFKEKLKLSTKPLKTAIRLPLKRSL